MSISIRVVVLLLIGYTLVEIRGDGLRSLAESSERCGEKTITGNGVPSASSEANGPFDFSAAKVSNGECRSKKTHVSPNIKKTKRSGRSARITLGVRRRTDGRRTRFSSERSEFRLYDDILFGKGLVTGDVEL